MRAAALLAAVLPAFGAQPVVAAAPPPAVGMEGAASGAATVPKEGVALQGLDGRTITLSLADLSALPVRHVALRHEGTTADYAGPDLASVLKAVNAPLGPRMHGPAVATVVRITARDGYRVVLSLGEIDPELRPSARAILAVRKDGQPLPASEGPVRLVIDGDDRPARDARQVVALALTPPG